VVEARAAAVGSLATAVCELDLGHPTRVAIDGITAAGKSTLVAELGEAVGRTGRVVATLTLDGYHHPRAYRYRQGRLSAVGYYDDAFDCMAFVTHVLGPLGAGGRRRYRRRIHDLVSDRRVDEEPIEVPADAVVVVDGSFLQRPELSPHWDYRIFVETTFEVARVRGVRRDADFLGGSREAAELYDIRYHPACRRYLESVRPAEEADVIVGNDDPARPSLRWAGRRAPGAR
jgi:uridine kinase